MLLKGKKAAILVESDFQDLEVFYPLLRLREEGALVMTIGTGSAPRYKGKYGLSLDVDLDAKVVLTDWIDAIIIPGGWAPDKLRLCPDMLRLTREMDAAGKIIGCICHGGWLLASAGILKDRRVTSYEAIRDDLVHAGALWEDTEVVVDRNLITSRRPDDLPAFMREIIRALAG